jgi:hypothetical protein
MASGTFGERLKREREMREVTLKEVTTATRIGPRFLEALENEEWDKLPGGVFNRGFVRAIARFLGLDEENLLAEYDLAHGEPNMPAPQPYENQLFWLCSRCLPYSAGLLPAEFMAGGVLPRIAPRKSLHRPLCCLRESQRKPGQRRLPLLVLLLTT